MLNETWRLWQALERAKIEIEPQHPLIHPLPNSEKNLLRVRLNDQGEVVSVEGVADNERSGIKRIVRSSDGSFPVIKINKPLLNITDSVKWNDIKELEPQITKSWADVGWKWSNSLEKANVLIEKLAGDEKGENIVRLARSFRKSLENNTAFISKIGTIALDRLRTGQLASSERVVRELLIGKGKDNRGKDKKISLLFVLELENDNLIYQMKLWQRIADVLPTNLSATERIHEHHADKSAFGGNGILLKEPFPSVKLKTLGAYFPLMSMASDTDKAKCNKRYGLTEYITCPVTTEQSRRMLDALTWIVTRDEGTTWRGVASGKFEMDGRTKKKKELRDLLIVFVDEKPDVDAKTASYFGSGSGVTQAQFEVDAKAVCDALNSVVRAHPKSRLNMFLLRKASDGQAQIALAESPTVKEVLDAAERWQRAVHENLPVVTLYLQPSRTFDKKNIPEVKDARPLAPYPDQVVRLLSYQWVRDGSSPRPKGAGKPQKPYHEVIGPGLGDVLALMLRMEGKWKSVASQMLDLLVRRTEPLLIGVFGAQHAYGPRKAQGRHEPLFDYPRPSRETALRAVAVFGILLEALESRKEMIR